MKTELKVETPEKSNGTLDKVSYLETLKADKAKIDQAAEQAKSQYLILLGKAEAFGELIAYHESAQQS